MSSYSRGEVVLVRYPFSDLSGSKVRPAVIINSSHASQDLFILPLTSKTGGLLSGEFILRDWKQAGLNVPTAVKRGIYTIHNSFIIKKVGEFSDFDNQNLDKSLHAWLGI